MAYIILVSGWVGYARSMSEKPHKDNIHGALRFLIDLVILFEYFYLLQLTENLANFQNEFHWVVMIVFATYAIWDVVRYFEYHGKRERKVVRNRGGRTLVFCMICAAVSASYHFLVIEGVSGLDVFQNKQAQTLNFIALTLIMILGYRMVKWNVKDKKVRF